MDPDSKSNRLLSLDALRGFDMLLIAGGGEFLVLLNGKTGLTWVDALSMQMRHPAWNGFTFYDFIMPLFLFIAGVSLSFSIGNGLARGLTKTQLYRKAAQRMMVLIILGIIYKNAPVTFFEPANIRVASVLGRIGIATFATTILYLNFNWQKRMAWVVAILVGYFSALWLIPVPGYGAGDLTFEGNLVAWFDQNFLPGRLHQGTYDELGLLTQFPSICLTLLGAWAGQILTEPDHNRKTVKLLLLGLASILIGLTWGLVFPINKHLWTSSFILLTGGMSFLILTLFYWIIDVRGFTRWAFFFKVIGMNSLLIYFGYRFIDFNHTSRLLFEGIYSFTAKPWHEVFQAVGAVGLVWIFLYFMYRNKLFLKV